jgi:hypothetical protein
MIFKPLLRSFGLMSRCRVLLEYPWSILEQSLLKYPWSILEQSLLKYPWSILEQSLLKCPADNFSPLFNALFTKM